MKKISKIMSLVLAGVMVLSMTACGGNTAETTAAATEAQKETAADAAAKAEPPIRLAYSSWCSTPLWTLPMTVSSLP